MNPMKLRELPHLRVHVRAVPEICFEVIASAGREIERAPGGERLVAFRVETGRRVVETKEILRAREHDRIDYRWVEGPLPFVEETIFIDPAPGGAVLRYEGRFAVDAPALVRPVARWWIARVFARAVRAHLSEAKTIAEQRAARSRLYPREEPDEAAST